MPIVYESEYLKIHAGWNFMQYVAICEKHKIKTTIEGSDLTQYQHKTY